MSGIKTSFDFNVFNFAPLEQVAPKEKSELERAKEEAEARSKKKAEEEMMSSMGGTNGKAKNTKKVGFATSSHMNFTGQGTTEVQMRTRPILSDEHEQT